MHRTLGDADYTASFGAELLEGGAAAGLLPATAGGGFQPAVFREGQPTKTRVSIVGLIGEMLAATLSPAGFRFLDLGCGDGEILENIHSKFGVPWRGLWGVTAEDLRGFFDDSSPGFEPALASVFEPWKAWKGNEKQWVESTIAFRERTLGRIAREKRRRASTNLHRSAPAEWNERQYIIHDIQQLHCHGAFQEAVRTEGKFHMIVSFTCFCYLHDSLGVVEHIYNFLLADGGVFVANAIHKVALAGEGGEVAADGELGAPFAQLAARLRARGFDFRCYNENETKLVLIMRKHESSPRVMQLGEHIGYTPVPPEHTDGSLPESQTDVDARPVYQLKPDM